MQTITTVGLDIAKSEGVPIRKQLLGLDWPGAEALLKRGQGQAW